MFGWWQQQRKQSPTENLSRPFRLEQAQGSPPHRNCSLKDPLLPARALQRLSELLLCLPEYWQEDVLPAVHSKPGWAERWEGLCQGLAEGKEDTKELLCPAGMLPAPTSASPPHRSCEPAAHNCFLRRAVTHQRPDPWGCFSPYGGTTALGAHQESLPPW